MNDAMAEAAGGALRQRRGLKVGRGDGGRHAGAVVLDGELGAAGDDVEGYLDEAGGIWGSGAGVLDTDGFGGVADEVDGDALDDLGREAEGGKRGGATDGDRGSARGDAREDRGEVAEKGGVVGRGEMASVARTLRRRRSAGWKCGGGAGRGGEVEGRAAGG